VAKANGKASHRETVSTARRLENARNRWQITLACGHTTVVTATTKPAHAFCRACSSNAQPNTYKAP
jgi:hypothetical protein